MKKINFLLIILGVSLGAWAQETTSAVVTTSEPIVLKSKRGINILPEAKEWALGVSANPFLTYTGSIFSSGGNTSPSFDFAPNLTNNIAVFGKYMVDAHTAYRVRFNASVNSTAVKRTILQDEVTPDVNYPNFTQDWRKRSSQTIVLAAGYEKRRGSSRVQGVYGGEVLLGYSNLSDTYEYGNPISQDFNQPTTNNFGSNIFPGFATFRKTEENFGGSLFIGARGFIGVEYFIGPKVSLGGEFGYSFVYRSTGKSDFTAEGWNSLTGSAQKTKVDSNNGNYSSFIGTQLDNLDGAINLLFYF
jgi:hypothetical protein